MTDYATILAEAIEAANAAQARALAPYGGVEPQSACGFAWVNVNPATHPFVRWCKAELAKVGMVYDRTGNVRGLGGYLAHQETPEQRDARKYGSPGYPKGWQFWKPGSFRGQWIDCHEAGAQAFAEVLRAHDIPAYAGSRLD